jgi:hypothetical protein
VKQSWPIPGGVKRLGRNYARPFPDVIEMVGVQISESLHLSIRPQDFGLIYSLMVA